MPRILFFGRLRDLAGDRAFAPPADVRTLARLRDWLARTDDALGAELSRPGVRIALNHALASDLSVAFAPNDEIAFMSPLSGG